MNVLLFTHIYPTRRNPTLGTFHRNAFQALSAYCDTRLVCPQPFWSRLHRPETLFRVAHEREEGGIPITLPTYWSVPKVPACHARGMYASLKPYIASLRRDFPFDAILAAWGYPDAVAASWLARDFDCPLVVKILGSDINSLAQHPSLRRQIQHGLGQAHRIITVSSALRDRVVELGIDPERVLVQHNGVNGDQFLPRDKAAVRAQLGLSTERRVIVYVGRLHPVKGVDVLVEAMGHLAGLGRDDVELHLVGGGELEEDLKARTRQLGIEQQVYFHGTRLHTEIPLWISASDVFCLPSRNEGCPNVILEALASGRPVVATEVGGIPELLNAENGVLVPSENPVAMADGLADALGRTWEDAALRASVEFLSWDDVGRKYRDILISTLHDTARLPVTEARIRSAH